VGRIDWGDLRTTGPVSRDFGFDRGTPIDRYYIERFLAAHSTDVRGHVMETGTDMYTRRFGGEFAARSDVLHYAADNPRATIVGDLTKHGDLPERQFDCIICTQTLQFLFDVEAAVGNLYRALKPRGVLLVTSSGISQISHADMKATGDYWRFTDASTKKLLTRFFSESGVEVSTYGNVMSSLAFLHGIAVAELAREELDVKDSSYQLVVAARAIRLD
jgi:SAM-dependent methyltransferase